MKKTILSLVCLIMMSAMSVSAKRVVYVSNHHPAHRDGSGAQRQAT